MADSSTEAMPEMMSPSPGMSCPASTTTTSPSLRSEDGTSMMATDNERASGSPFSSYPRTRWAGVVVRVLRSASAWALPRPSATASARFANSTVAHRHTDPGEIHRLARAQFRNEQLEHSEERQECGAHPYHEHDGVVPHLGGTEFPERRRQTLAQHRRQRCVVAGTHVVDDVVCGRGRHVMPPNLLPTVPEQASGRTSARK